jgi:copine 5/8/9
MEASNFKAGGAAVPTTQVEIAVSCRNLLDMDITSKSDPMCVLYVKQFASEAWREYGRSEVIWDNLNPDFVKKFVMDYFFEESQKLKFELYDVDSESPDLRKHDFLGSMECTLGEVVSLNRLQRPLRGPRQDSGCIILVSAEELSSCKDEITLQFCAVKLDKKDFFGKSDPFLVFSRTNENGTFTVVHKTEAVMKTLNPTWKPFTILVRTLCNGDLDRVIKVECFDWNRSGSHELIGQFSTSVRELSGGPGPSNDYECICPAMQAKKGKKYTNSGFVKLMQCQIVQVPTFMDYIKGGTQIHCTIAVDFTASNGDPRSPTSLHYMDPYQPNLYARALRAVGDIIQDYDTDKLFPALGFGAKVPPDGHVSHEIFLNGHPTNPYCQGVEGVLQAYYRTLQAVQLYGPTNFAPVINHVARIATQMGRRGENYFILLILTDGIITDMPQTCEAIVNASVLPLSIIIVGIGSAEFDAMNTLDGDDVRLSSRGRYAERDIVQFVPFREFIGGRYGNDLTRSQAMLAKEVLAEIPDQFLSFMRKNGIRPNPAQAANRGAT